MTEYTAETLTTMKTVDLRKLAKEFGIQKINRDGSEVSVNTGRKGELIPEILRQQEFKATFVSAEGRKNPNRHPVYGWPVAGEQPSADDPKPVNGKAVRTAKGVKGRKCAECGTRLVDRKTQGRDSTMCHPCFEYAGWENQHSDDDHEANGLEADCPVCQELITPAPVTAEISPKAKRFEADAIAAGWSALARVAPDGSGISLVTARAEDGRELELRWNGAVCVDGENYLTRPGGKKIKVRNASAARKILAGATA